MAAGTDGFRAVLVRSVVYFGDLRGTGRALERAFLAKRTDDPIRANRVVFGTCCAPIVVACVWDSRVSATLVDRERALVCPEFLLDLWTTASPHQAEQAP